MIIFNDYFIFGTKFFWNKGIETCFNVECVLLGRNFDFLGCYLVVTAPYLVVTADYCSLPGGYWWLLLVATFSMNVLRCINGLCYLLSSESKLIYCYSS